MLAFGAGSLGNRLAQFHLSLSCCLHALGIWSHYFNVVIYHSKIISKLNLSLVFCPQVTQLKKRMKVYAKAKQNMLVVNEC